jgi:hypothetical protein
METLLIREVIKARAIGKKAMTRPARIKGIFFTKKITKRIALNKARKRIRKSAPKPLALRLPSVTKVEK